MLLISYNQNETSRFTNMVLESTKIKNYHLVQINWNPIKKKKVNSKDYYIENNQIPILLPISFEIECLKKEKETYLYLIFVVEKKMVSGLHS